MWTQISTSNSSYQAIQYGLLDAAEFLYPYSTIIFRTKSFELLKISFHSAFKWVLSKLEKRYLKEALQMVDSTNNSEIFIDVLIF